MTLALIIAAESASPRVEDMRAAVFILPADYRLQIVAAVAFGAAIALALALGLVLAIDIATRRSEARP